MSLDQNRATCPNAPVTEPANTQTQVEIRAHPDLASISAQAWDACACPEAENGRAIDPFTTHRFLSALERSASVGGQSGWHPHHLTVEVDGRVIACAPLYVKHHSQGEYVFDHGWAEAFERAGGSYYPKLQLAVPFTPVTGRRLLVRPGFETIGQAALVQGAVQTAADNDLSSLHITFCTEDEAQAGEEMGLLPRVGLQYHWENNNFRDFDGFLTSLTSRKRKAIRKERRSAQSFGGEIVSLTGGDLKPAHWDAFWRFYQDTGARKWGSPYLTRAFFDLVQDTMRDDVLLVLAIRNGEAVAGALNFIGRDTLFGRYWGATEHHPCLHFELCYYQAIDYAIANGLSRVEAGAQGDHKRARGYAPVATHSLHWIRDAGFRSAVERFVAQEAQMIGNDIEALAEMGPFRKTEDDP
ncbi:GNAT family N-acetyltransferase [Aliiroseovarius lamellibrachiae]|uniref:GNAT family N-acetyltransferase n=1 Tax=Aliiroseovarius lamellibrachiae TaxID=1924933 RepID=UPI001BE00368|nr:GNAT family N-acetyltransferase [Aliiroseovarius lamellibrachiae]MBT2130210.1 GNAT family N-acetyltransferase [Aliiroseovarius lamellibrachiae]